MTDTLWTDATKIWVGFIQEDSPAGLYQDIRHGYLIWKTADNNNPTFLYFPTKQHPFFTSGLWTQVEEVYARYIGSVRLQLGPDVAIMNERASSGAIIASNGTLSLHCRSEQTHRGGSRVSIGTYPNPGPNHYQAIFPRWRLILDDDSTDERVLFEYPGSGDVTAS